RISRRYNDNPKNSRLPSTQRKEYWLLFWAHATNSGLSSSHSHVPEFFHSLFTFTCVRSAACLYVGRGTLSTSTTCVSTITWKSLAYKMLTVIYEVVVAIVNALLRRNYALA